MKFRLQNWPSKALNVATSLVLSPQNHITLHGSKLISFRINLPDLSNVTHIEERTERIVPWMPRATRHFLYCGFDPHLTRYTLFGFYPREISELNGTDYKLKVYFVLNTFQKAQEGTFNWQLNSNHWLTMRFINTNELTVHHWCLRFSLESTAVLKGLFETSSPGITLPLRHLEDGCSNEIRPLRLHIRTRVPAKLPKCDQTAGRLGTKPRSISLTPPSAISFCCRGRRQWFHCCEGSSPSTVFFSRAVSSKHVFNCS